MPRRSRQNFSNGSHNSKAAQSRRRSTLADLATIIGISESDLASELQDVERSYRCFKNRDGRVILEPKASLKLLQQRILRRSRHLGEGVIPHPAAHGGIKGRSPLTNVLSHVPAVAISKIDIERFYPSVTPGMVRHALRPTKLEGEALESLLRLTVCSRGLPTGAPTSPWVGNLVLRDIDRHLYRFCTSRAIRYTRYVDDLTFSGERCEDAYWECRAALAKSGFHCSEHKCLRRSLEVNAVLITGIVIRGRDVALPETYLSKVRELIERCSRGQALQQPRLQGHLAYIRGIAPALADEFETRLAARPEA